MIFIYYGIGYVITYLIIQAVNIHTYLERVKESDWPRDRERARETLEDGIANNVMLSLIWPIVILGLIGVLLHSLLTNAIVKIAKKLEK